MRTPKSKVKALPKFGLGCHLEMTSHTSLVIGNHSSRNAIRPDAMGRIAYDTELVLPTILKAANIEADSEEAEFVSSASTGRHYWPFVLEYDRSTETSEFFATTKAEGYTELYNTIKTGWPLEWGSKFPVILVVSEGSPSYLLTLITAVRTQLLGSPSEADITNIVQASAKVAEWPGRVDFVHCPNWGGEKLVQELKARHYALLASQGRGYDLVVLDYLQRLGRSSQTFRVSEHEALAANVRLFSDTINELNIAGLMTSQVGRSETKQYEPPDLDEGLGTGDIERCSNQLLALAVSADKSVVKYAIRKNTFGEVGGTGELIYDARRLCFL